MLTLRRRPSAREALTLIEVVIAVAILSVILLGMFSAIASAQQADRLTREHAAVSEAAFNVMDEMLTGGVPEDGDPARVLQFPVTINTGRGQVDLLPARSFPTDLWTLAGATAPAPVTEPGVAVAYIKVDGDAANTDLMEVRVLVAWQSADGSDQRVELVSRRVR